MEGPWERNEDSGTSHPGSASAAETETSPRRTSGLTLPSGLLAYSHCFCIRYFQLQLPAGWGTHLRQKVLVPSTDPTPRSATAACGFRMKGETPVNSTMSIGQARKMVEQLKIEASLCRIKVSKAAADLMTYCDAHACEDPLITPVPTSENPFREKKFFCALL
ncbi:guanine nucleotide-binding protein G(I)/G(S)/G(O) subunit gamma-3 [Piliocolobus tephrosceles]|uniref:Guanine nucleotide-binding protein subunit gamma n=1 Tax=Piliocolobus tephrosceles TaxID=591936 RepID=A0A8C9H0C6_9PRIM|nr:guanine nucleotide-binding protein G(I)/G(S)/G(O) subunit gamma-3 [Piliocolobus tephrosceles]